jgi:cell wall-associated NlpC family hydrolase
MERWQVAQASRNTPMSVGASPSSLPGLLGPPRVWQRLRALSRLTRLVLALAVLVPLAAGGGVATAAKSPTTAQLVKQVEQEQAAAEAATERYNAVRVQLQSIDVRVSAARNRLAEQQKQVDVARRALGAIAAERYRQGDLASLSLLLSDNPDVLLAQSGLLATIGDREAAAVQRLADAQRKLTTDNADLLAQGDRLRKASNDLNALKEAADAKVRATKARLASLTAAQRAAVLRAGQGSVPSGMTCAEAGIPPMSPRIQKVIAYACAQIGKPYEWGADGPGSFDCSGLTMKAWAQSGVSLPHLASAQYSGGTHISMSALQPGDLVFRNGLGHVGISIGNGLMVHAPHTGDHVRIAPISSDMIAARY